MSFPCFGVATEVKALQKVGLGSSAKQCLHNWEEYTQQMLLRHRQHGLSEALEVNFPPLY